MREPLRFIHDDGGRYKAGFSGRTGDCAVRACAIATGLPYGEVYETMWQLAKAERVRNEKKRSNPRKGMRRKTIDKFLKSQGFEWVPTMLIGSGCVTHLAKDEIPMSGNVVARVSKHVCAVVNGVVHDNHHPSDDGERCVYGYWYKP